MLFFLFVLLCVLGQLCHYEEEYQRMLEELDQASLLDPGWTAPRDKLGSSWDFLTAMANLISCKVCMYVHGHLFFFLVKNTV